MIKTGTKIVYLMEMGFSVLCFLFVEAFRILICRPPHGSVGKVFACDAGDTGLIPGLGRTPRKGNGNPFQYSCLKNPMDRGTWRATVYGVAKSWI